MLSIAFLAMSYLPPPDAWRITPSRATGEMGQGWVVRELMIYASTDCSGSQIAAASSISSDYTTGAQIIDGIPSYNGGALDTGGVYWELFGQSNLEARAAWVGYVAATPTEGRCLRVAQCGSTGCAPWLMLQSRVNGQWNDVIEFAATHGSWTEVSWTPPPAAPAPTPPPPDFPPPPADPPPLAPGGGGTVIIIVVAVAVVAVLFAIIVAYLLCGKAKKPAA